MSWEFCVGRSWDFLCAYDLVILADTIDELLKMDLWKEHQEAKRLRENIEKTKIMVANICTHVTILVNTRFYIFRKRVGSNLIFWTKCQLWIYKKCSGVAIYLKNEPRYRYKILIKIWAPVLRALWRLVDGRPEKQLTLKDAKLDVVESFHYPGGILFPVGGCELTRIVRTRAAWGKILEAFLFLLLSQRF